MTKLYKRFGIFMVYVGERLSEPSTWQGLAFLLTLMGCKLGANMDWGQAAGLGGIISAAIKMFFPDAKK